MNKGRKIAKENNEESFMIPNADGTWTTIKGARSSFDLLLGCALADIKQNPEKKEMYFGEASKYIKFDFEENEEEKENL